jgi:D-arabinose 1-dehydrogenase-like Zn-dependent alcohol dehydrogenase
MNEMLRLCAAKGIEPMVQLAPLSDVNAQMERVRAGEARYRIVLLSDEEWAKKQAGS